MKRFIFGFVVGVFTVWLYGLYQYFKMTADEWNEIYAAIEEILPHRKGVK